MCVCAQGESTTVHEHYLRFFTWYQSERSLKIPSYLPGQFWRLSNPNLEVKEAIGCGAQRNGELPSTKINSLSCCGRFDTGVCPNWSCKSKVTANLQNDKFSTDFTGFAECVRILHIFQISVLVKIKQHRWPKVAQTSASRSWRKEITNLGNFA